MPAVEARRDSTVCMNKRQLWQHAPRPNLPESQHGWKGFVKSHPWLRRYCQLMTASWRKSQFSWRTWSLKKQSMVLWMVLHPSTYRLHQWTRCVFKKSEKAHKVGRGHGKWFGGEVYQNTLRACMKFPIKKKWFILFSPKNITLSQFSNPHPLSNINGADVRPAQILNWHGKTTVLKQMARRTEVSSVSLNLLQSWHHIGIPSPNTDNSIIKVSSRIHSSV